ncbi:uncharacterized protein LOC123536677 isoform X2 [Mercenaria mercenaria]|uniref:uncharacterized protein LOC123536677 isoform X2 n=1 Tax=Mercenaria mercenaria TaxID=6596 RepID=UPI00234EBA33|nr:uncharacterized protein LOC123536677 isoform X2 [Mercenaria mercenaria]
MPRHGTGLGAGNFPAANKLLMRYENDRAYKLHLQKVNNVKHRLDVSEPKKQNHLILRLKQIQKEEERQAEIDHENKILLNKMTHVLKYGGNIDNWNNYESRSLNYPFREKQNEEIARENMGIARRLETVKPKLAINKWERDYQQHQYLKRLWSDSVKDFGEFTPRRYRSRMSRTRSMENSLDDTYDEDFQSVDTAEEKKLPKVKKDGKRNQFRTAKSESSVPVTQKKDDSKTKTSTKLPKIIPHKAEKTKKADGVSGQAKEGGDDNSDVAQLFKIAKQLGRPEDIFIKTLIKKSHKQRMVTKAKFRQKYDLDLISELKNGLGQPWEYLIDALLQERGVADSYAVFDALSGRSHKKTADMCDVVELLCSRDNATIAELKESYRKEFSISLEEDMSDRSKPPLQTVLLTLQKGARDESPDVDSDQVKKDAQAIYEYGEGCWDSDNGVFMKLLNERSYAHLQAVFSEYKTVAGGQDILQAMKKECAKDYYKILSTLVHCIGSPASYYADQLHRHKLPTDPVFVGTLALRSEIDMPEVRKVYKKMYSVDITEDIKEKSHPTQKCLIELACKVPPGSKKKADAKKTYVKDGTANQQSHPQPAHAKKPPAGKKSEPKAKGQGQSESGDTAVTGSTKTDTEAKNSKKSEQKPDQQSKSKDNQENSTKQKRSPTGARDGNHRGTVKPASNFRPEDDCDKLNSAMSGERADESVVVSIIPKRSNKQRQQLKSTYEQKYKKNLTIDLTSEMTGDWEEIVLALMMTPAEYDAHVVREAVEGLGTSEPTLIAILCTRSAQELKAIKEHYRKGGGGDFDMDVTRDCGADLKNLLLHLARGERAAGTAVNIQQAQKDAKDLHQNGVLSDTFVAVVTKQNHFQVKATFDEFKKVAGEDIYAAITKSSLGDDEDVYISIAKAVEDPVEFYAEKLHGCFTSMGTNDNLLIRLVVPRSEVDLEDIKLRYYELYSRTLYDAVNAQCQGDYKAMLLAVINNDVNGGKGQQKKQNKPTAAATTSSRKDSSQKSTSGATVKPAKPFNPIEDSERLNEAMSGFGTDEAVVIDILPYRSNDQRQEIKAKYQDKYNKDLQKQLESELRGDFEEIVLAMMMKPVDYACHSLHHAVKGLGTKEGILIGVLCTKTGKELAVIKNRYKEIYGTDLQSAITQDVSGGMEEMFVQILKCERDQGETVNTQEAKEDARRLYKEGQISIDPTDEVFKSIIAKKSRAQVRATFQEYKKLTGNDIYVGIQKALMGDEEDAYLGLARAVEDPVWFYAEAIHGCFDGFGTNDTRLIRIIVSRSEIDLVDIKAKYKSMYKKTISERVEQECNGDSKKMLLAILGDLSGNDGKSQQKKATKPAASKNENVQKATSGPTVKPANPFSPVKDSERLNGAMSGFGTDEAVVVDILPYRSNDQRQEVKAKYQDKYNKNLQEQLESELRGDFEEIVLAMMMKPVDYACHSLHEAVKGLGTKEGILIGVLCTKTGKELAMIKNRYKEIYGKDLQLAITQDVSGGMEDMFVEILKCERDQGESVNIQEAKEDAKRLYKEGQISIDPTDEVFKSAIARKSRVQVRAIFQEYKKLTGNDIYAGIQKALMGDEEDAYLGLARAVEDPVWFYAEVIHGCFDGIGTNDTRLIRVIVSRSEIDLADIKTKYKSLYKKTISERIEQECKGDYKKMLLAILGDL